MTLNCCYRISNRRNYSRKTIWSLQCDGSTLRSVTLNMKCLRTCRYCCHDFTPNTYYLANTTNTPSFIKITLFGRKKTQKNKKCLALQITRFQMDRSVRHSVEQTHQPATFHVPSRQSRQSHEGSNWLLFVREKLGGRRKTYFLPCLSKKGLFQPPIPTSQKKSSS